MCTFFFVNEDDRTPYAQCIECTDSRYIGHHSPIIIICSADIFSLILPCIALDCILIALEYICEIWFRCKKQMRTHSHREACAVVAVCRLSVWDGRTSTHKIVLNALIDVKVIPQKRIANKNWFLLFGSFRRILRNVSTTLCNWIQLITVYLKIYCVYLNSVVWTHSHSFSRLLCRRLSSFTSSVHSVASHLWSSSDHCDILIEKNIYLWHTRPMQGNRDIHRVLST